MRTGDVLEAIARGDRQLLRDAAAVLEARRQACARHVAEEDADRDAALRRARQQVRPGLDPGARSRQRRLRWLELPRRDMERIAGPERFDLHLQARERTRLIAM